MNCFACKNKRPAYRLVQTEFTVRYLVKINLKRLVDDFDFGRKDGYSEGLMKKGIPVLWNAFLVVLLVHLLRTIF